MNNSKVFRLLNIVTNISVVLVGVLVLTSLGYKYFYEPSLGSLEPELLRRGEDFKGLQEVDFKQKRNTILLAMNVNCRFCTESLPLYKKLISESDNNTVRVIALFNNKSEEVKKYLQENEISVEFIPDVDLVKLKVDTTPTIIWVDSDRKIVGSYQGILHEKQEIAFFQKYNRELFGK